MNRYRYTDRYIQTYVDFDVAITILKLKYDIYQYYEAEKFSIKQNLQMPATSSIGHETVSGRRPTEISLAIRMPTWFYEIPAILLVETVLNLL